LHRALGSVSAASEMFVKDENGQHGGPARPSCLDPPAVWRPQSCQMLFFIHDFVGALIAVTLFPLISVVPGYLLGSLFDLIDFRTRPLFVRASLSVVLSVSICPIVTYLDLFSAL